MDIVKKEYYEQLCAHKFDRWANSLKHSLDKLTRRNRYLNRPISIEQINSKF